MSKHITVKEAWALKLVSLASFNTNGTKSNIPRISHTRDNIESTNAMLPIFFLTLIKFCIKVNFDL